MRTVNRLAAGVVLGCLLASGADSPPAAASMDSRPPAVRYLANQDAAVGPHPELAAGQLLDYHPEGRGLVTEVFGDLTTADRVVVVVPGSDVDLGHYEPLRSMAEAVYAEAAGRAAVIAWAGYVTPVGLGVDAARSALAEDGADRLLALLSGLAPYLDADVALLCHSYGSVVCAHAAPALAETGVRVSDLVVFGSPGMDVDTVHDLGTTARVWAARAPADWIGWVPNVRWFGLGHGRDPVDPAFGATVLPVDARAHDSYLAAGSASLRLLTTAALAGAAEPVAATS